MFDAFSEARIHAAQIREFYEAYISAGFTEREAFALTSLLVGGMANSSR